MFFYLSLLTALALLVMRKYPLRSTPLILIPLSHDQWDITTVPPSYPMYP